MIITLVVITMMFWFLRKNSLENVAIHGKRHRKGINVKVDLNIYNGNSWSFSELKLD